MRFRGQAATTVRVYVGCAHRHCGYPAVLWKKKRLSRRCLAEIRAIAHPVLMCVAKKNIKPMNQALKSHTFKYSVYYHALQTTLHYNQSRGQKCVQTGLPGPRSTTLKFHYETRTSCNKAAETNTTRLELDVFFFLCMCV